MKKYLKLFWLFSIYSVKNTFQNRFGVWLFLFAKLMRFVMYFFFIYNLIYHTKLLAGYTLNETLIFFITFNLIDSLGQLLFREVYRFRPLIVNGELDSILIKPYHPFLRILTGGVDILDAFMLIPYIILLIIFAHQISALTFSNFSVYVTLILNSMIIATAFHIFVLALGILTTEIDHITGIYRDLSRMASFPIDIYREPLRSILTFVIPIGMMMTVPVKGLLGLLTAPFILFSFTLSVFLLMISLELWNHAIKKYQSWGS